MRANISWIMNAVFVWFIYIYIVNVSIAQVNEKITEIISHTLIGKLNIFFTINLLSNKEQTYNKNGNWSLYFLSFLIFRL